MISCERSVRPVEDTSTIYKVKPGISIFDFQRILRNYEIKLSDNEKDDMKSVFTMRMNSDYFDLEQILEIIDTLITQRRNT